MAGPEHKQAAHDTASSDPYDDWSPSGSVDAAPASVIELRHEAGLTAGHTLELHPGTFRLGPRHSDEGGLVIGAPEAASFDLTIDGDGRARLIAGDELVAVEGIIVDRPVHLDDGDVIQLTTDHFVVRSLKPRRPRRPSPTITPRTVQTPTLSSMSGWLWFFGLLALVGFILGFIRTPLFGLGLIGVGGIIATIAYRTSRHDRARRDHATQLANARSMFFNEIVEARKASAEALRSEANTPATVVRRAAEVTATKGSRLHATVASGDRSWTPPVVCHRDSGWDHEEVVQELAFLPAVPYTIDLDRGPIAIVGPRQAILAVARHLATTALVASPRGSGVSVETSIPADWRWIAPTSNPSLRILDDVSGDWEPRTVVLGESLADLVALGEGARLRHVIEIDPSGRATIHDADGTSGAGFTPHGITEEQARHVQTLAFGSDHIIDLTVSPASMGLERSEHDLLDSDRLLVTGPNRSRNKDVLATAALRQAARHPDRSIFILDRGDRALIRLAQLDACRRYVTIDQVAKVEYMVTEMEAIDEQASEERSLLLAPDLWEATAFYRNSGHSALADRIGRLVQRMEELPMAASAPGLERVPRDSFLVWINITNDGAEIEVDDRDGLTPATTEVLDIADLPGADLTGSVARLSTPLNQEDPS